MRASFSRLDADQGQGWGIRVDDEPATGYDNQTVTVVKRSGDTDQVTLGKCIDSWNGGNSAKYLLAPKAKVAKTQPILPDVPAGRYALQEQGNAVFIKVDRPTEGRWDGYTFVSIMHGENHEPVKQSDLKLGLLAAIFADIDAAVRRYGHYASRCGFCNIELTDPFSRFYGVGPDCRGHHGMPKSRAAFVREHPDQEHILVSWEAEDAEAQQS